MTEYELLDLMATQASTAQTSAQMLITIFSGYSVVAWLVGKQLSRVQVIAGNALFLFTQLVLIFAWQAKMQFASTLSKELLAQNPLRGAVPSENLIPLFSVALFSMLLTCLVFMWSVRHPKSE